MSKKSYKEKVCVLCEKTYKPVGANQIVCNRKLCRKRKKIEDDEKYLSQRRDYQRKLHGWKEQTKKCKTCKKKFKTWLARVITCSKECSYEIHKERVLKRYHSTKGGKQ